MKREETRQTCRGTQQGIRGLEELFYGWEHFEERELFDELARRARTYLKAYDEWLVQLEGRSKK